MTQTIAIEWLLLLLLYFSRLCIKLFFVSVHQTCEPCIDNKKGQSVPSAQDIAGFRQCLQKGASALFNVATGLPLQSSPVCTAFFFYAFPCSALLLLVGWVMT